MKIFAGKAAASYARAKLIIKLANDVARVVNDDPVVGDRLKVVFLPNYSVSLAEAIIPAADLSEQISTAGMEASGTGNMKLALNGALTIGTLDGANIEIREHVGADNIFIFGLTADEVAAKRRARGLRGRDVAAARRAWRMRSTASRAGEFSPDDPSALPAAGRRDARPRSVHGGGRFRCLLGRRSARSTRCGSDPPAWWRMSILNTARMGWFSSDRAIREYAAEIWRTFRSATTVASAGHEIAPMQALFIGQTYIDVTFLTDHIPTGDEKYVARGICGVVRRQRGDGGVLLRQARRQAGPDRHPRGRLARPHVPGHGGEVRHRSAHPRRSRRSSLSFIMPNDGKRAIVRCRDDEYLASVPGARPDRLPRAASRRASAGCRDALRDGLPRGGHPDVARRRRGARPTRHELLPYIDVAIVAERFCEQMDMTPQEMLDYLKARGCRIGGVTLGERGLLWYDESGKVAHDCRRCPCRRTASSTPAAPATCSTAPISIRTWPTRRSGWAEHFVFARAAAAFKMQHLGNEAGPADP